MVDIIHNSEPTCKKINIFNQKLINVKKLKFSKKRFSRTSLTFLFKLDSEATCLYKGQKKHKIAKNKPDVIEP